MTTKTEQKIEQYIDQQREEKRREAMRKTLEGFNFNDHQPPRITLDGRALAEGLAKREPGPEPEQTAQDVALIRAGRGPKK